MKNWMIAFFMLFSISAFGQEVDTAAVRVEVDSLIELNAEMLKSQKLDQALAAIEKAGEICLNAFDEETALYAKVLFNYGKTAFFIGDYTSAEARYKKAIDIQKYIIGTEHHDYAKSLEGLGICYLNNGEFKKAELLFVESKSIIEKISGKSHADYAKSINNLAIVYANLGYNDKVEMLFIEAVEINEITLGKDDPEYAKGINNLATFYSDAGNNKKALPLFLEAKSLFEKSQEVNNPLYAKCLNNLAALYEENKEYTKSENLLLQAINILKEAGGNEHPEYIFLQHRLAELYILTGNYDKAISYFSDLLNSHQKEEGKESFAYASTLEILAQLNSTKGNFENAEQLYLETKAIYEKVKGKSSFEYVRALNGLAIIYRSLNNNENAEKLYLEALSIVEKLQGKNNLEYALTCNNLGILNWANGKYEKAAFYCKEAMDSYEKISGREHTDYIGAMNNLGIMYTYMGELELAEKTYLESIELRKKVEGADNSKYASDIHNLAQFYYYVGKYHEAISLLEEAIIIDEKLIGKAHPEYLTSIKMLSSLCEKTGQITKAKELLSQSGEQEKNLLIRATRHLSEKELLNYIGAFKKNQGQFLSFEQNHEGLNRESFDNVLFHKGFILNASYQINHLSQRDSISANIFYRLKLLNQRLAVEYTKPREAQNSVPELEEKANNLEKELVRSVAGYGDAIRQVNWQEVQATLKPGEVALEFVNYEYYKPEPTDSVMYAALLIRPDDEEPEFIPLFEEKQLGALLSGASQEENIALAYDTRGIVPKKKVKKEGLYQLIWQPLEGHLDGVKNIYYSPGGALHRINFDAIPVADHSYLSDRYQLTRLGSTRSTVVKDLNNADANNAILFGGIEYKKDFAFTEKSVDTTLTVHATATGELPFSYADRSIGQREEGWKYLPGTQKEIENISQLLDQSGYENRSYSGFEASEEVFKKIGKEKASPRILHIATHGFFFPDPVDSLQGRGSEPVFKISDHPMIRSGLVLAGSNQAWKTGQAASPELEDGILTAYEISQMDLSHTELVVLSACETGLGDIDSNEGVYGLQRAFKIAGAKYLIMSLWQIPDQQTQELMTLFYSKWLEGGLEIPQAFQSAQKEMRATYPNPYLWAGFVLME